MRGSAGKPDKKKKGWIVRGEVAEEAVFATERRHRRRPSQTLLLFVLLAILSGVALWLVPGLQVAAARDRLASEADLLTGDRLGLENQLFQAENAARSTLALILAGSGLLLGLGVAWRRFEISRDLRTHERFARAVEQLASERGDGSVRTDARLGGIYALERLAGEWDREYWPVMEVLTAYVRENAAWQPGDRGLPGTPLRPPADIQTILAVIGRRTPHSATLERRLLDLRETDLRGANLSGARMDGVTLQGAHLEQVDATRAVLIHSNLREANLGGASLTYADLEGASLSRASLEGARLNGANLKGADLSGANLRGADLWEANLRGCNLKDADLRGADLSQSMLEEAIMWRADLQDAVLTGAHLRGTHLERANLAGATGLTWEQGEDAYTDENTILPEYLLPEQARQAVEAGSPLIALPATPTPAARRTPQRVAARVSAPSLPAIKPTAPSTSAPLTAPSKQAAAPASASATKQVAAAASAPAAASVVAPAHEAAPSAPAHRSAPAASPLAPSAFAPARRSAPTPARAAAPPPKDNVVQLNPAKPKPPAAKQQLIPSPKKSALPKHRKPGLVKPA